MKRLTVMVVVAAMAAVTSAPVAAAQPFQNIYITEGAALFATIAPDDGRNTGLLILGSDYREASGGASGYGGSYAQSIAFIDGIQRYCDEASNDLITRYINGGNFDLEPAAVMVNQFGTSGRIRTVMTDVLVSEYHFHFPNPGCTGLDPVLTFVFGTTSVMVDVTFTATAPTSPSAPVTQVFPYSPGLGVDVSVNSSSQAPAVLSGTIHTSDPNWDIGDVGSILTPQCFVALGSSIGVTVRTP